MSDYASIDAFALPRDFAVYLNFNRAEDMAETVEILRENGIVVRVSGEDAGEWKEAVIIGAPLKPDYWIEIPALDFEKANFILRDHAEANLTEEEIDAHPFSDYSPEELKQVLIEEEKWSPLAIAVARKLLLRSGEEIDLRELRREARERIRRAYTPRRGNFFQLIAATALGVFSGVVLWFIGGMLSLGILLYYALGVQRDPDGNKHYAYTPRTRQRGQFGLLLLGLSTVAGLANFFFLHIADFSSLQRWLWFWP